MFTGLVEAVGRLAECKMTNSGARLRVESPLAGELQRGDSLAVNGVCLTVILAEPTEIHADVGPETLRVTTLGGIPRGALVNLERPLRADQRLGGHFVQGHVDAVGHVEDLREEAGFHWLTVSFPAELSPYLVYKGSIAVDGISLTVAGLGGDRFDVQLVPHTIEHTNLRKIQVRDRVNLECDVIGKYVARALDLSGVTAASARTGGVRH
jgi:riboflavin synthase